MRTWQRRPRRRGTKEAATAPLAGGNAINPKPLALNPLAETIIVAVSVGSVVVISDRAHSAVATDGRGPAHPCN